MKLPFRYYCYLGLCLLFAGWVGLSAPIVSAQSPNDPIIPPKPTATNTTEPKAKLEIVRYETDPAEVRAQESFTLILKIKNLGTSAATEWAIRQDLCPGKDFAFEDGCIRSIPTLQPDESITVSFRVRYTQKVNADQVSAKLLSLLLLDEKQVQSGLNRELSIFVLASRTIGDETPVVKRPFPKPLLVVHRTWTAKARATVNELLTAVPLVINKLSISNGIGGPEFEVVVELQNQGSVDASNIFIDFCDTGDNFNPVYAGCRKQVPTTLAPGANAIASQTMAYKNQLTPPATPTQRGDMVKVEITYEFWYEGQWLRESISDTVYLYPQFFPAVTPIPALTGDEHNIDPDLFVNTPQLNVRSGPGVNYPIVGVTYQGARFLVKAHHQHEWWQINFNGVLAWVSAQYVIARGVEKIEQVTTTPVPPPPTPVFIPNPNPVGGSDFAATTIPVKFADAPVTPTATPTPLRQAPLQQAHGEPATQVLLVNAAAEQGQSGGVTVASLANAPLVMVERYQALPAQPQPGEPFRLELVLRNIGARPAQQLLLSWQGTAIIPLGTGTTIALADLSAGDAVTIQGHFVINTTERAPVIYLPIQLRYADEAGQITPYTEQLALLPQAAGGVLPWQPAEVDTERPLWLRVLFGLLGLGAEE